MSPWRRYFRHVLCDAIKVQTPPESHARALGAQVLQILKRIGPPVELGFATLLMAGAVCRMECLLLVGIVFKFVQIV